MVYGLEAIYESSKVHGISFHWRQGSGAVEQYHELVFAKWARHCWPRPE